jgi:hypothetical protein
MADDANPPMTDDQYDAMKAQVDTETARRNAAAAAARAAKLKPLTGLVASDAFTAMRAMLPDAITAAQGEPALVQVNSLQSILSNLAALYPAPSAPAASA